MALRVTHLVIGSALAAALVGTADAAGFSTIDGIGKTSPGGTPPSMPPGTAPPPMPPSPPPGPKPTPDAPSKPGAGSPPMLPAWKPPLPLPDPGVSAPKAPQPPAGIASVTPGSGCAGTTFSLRVDRFTPRATVGALVVTPEGTELLVNPEPTDAQGRAVLTVKTSTGTPAGVYRAHIIDVNTGRKVVVPYTVMGAGSSADCGVLEAKPSAPPKPPKPPVINPPPQEPLRKPEPPASSGPLPVPVAAQEPVVLSAVPADHATPSSASPALGMVITFALLAFLVERLTNGLVVVLGYWTRVSRLLEPRVLADPAEQARADRNRRVALFGLTTAVATIGAFALNVNVLRDLGIDAVRGPAALLITGLLIGAGADPIRDLINSRSRPRDAGERAAPIQVTGTLVLQQPGAMANGASTVAQLHAEEKPARAA